MSLGIKAFMTQLAAGSGNTTAEAGPEKVTASWGRMSRDILGEAQTAAADSRGPQSCLHKCVLGHCLWLNLLEESAGARGPWGFPREVV